MRLDTQKAINEAIEMAKTAIQISKGQREERRREDN
jgi:hypothetical protein